MFKVNILEKWKGKVILQEYEFENEEKLKTFLKLCKVSNHFVISVKKIYTMSA